MLKILGIGTLILCATAFVKVSCSLEIPANWSRNFSISTSNSSTVSFNGHLYTVWKNQSHIHINSSDSNYHTCDIAVDANRDVINGKLEITSTNEEIFIVGVKSITGNEQYKYTILRVDPKSCSYESADISETNDNRGDYFLPRLVKNPTGTDVFFPDLQNCSPCRLNNAGLRARGATARIPQETSPPGLPFHVNFIDPMNSYFYVYNSHNYSAGIRSTTIKLLDSNDLSTNKERVVDFPVYAVSKQKDSIKFMGVCSKTLNKFIAGISAYTEVFCERINSTLSTTSTVRIPIEPNSEPISSISYEFDKEGNSYISFAEASKLRLYIHNKDGKLIKAIDMGVIDGRFEQYPENDPEYFDAYQFWDVRGFLAGDEYCIITEQVTTKYTNPLHQVRCIDVKNYVKN